MTIVERALKFVPNGSRIGLGSGRAAAAFVKRVGECVRSRRLQVQGVPTSEETAPLARQEGIPLLNLAEAGELALTVDGADEVDPDLNLIKGYGRAWSGRRSSPLLPGCWSSWLVKRNLSRNWERGANCRSK